MSNEKKRRLPWVLMTLGALMALVALVMVLQTRSVLQYTVVTPDPGEKGEAIAKLAEAGSGIGAELKEALTWTVVGGEAESVSLTAGDNTSEATLFAMGEGWLEVYPRFLTWGRRIGESELANGDRVMMLDEGLAFRLFGEELPEDAKVTINENPWRVVGVVRHGGGPLHGRGVGDRALYDAYVPLIAAAREAVDLDTLTLSAVPQSNGAGAAQLFEEAARNEWVPGGELINLSKEAMRRTILPRVLLLIVGLYALVGLFKRMTALCMGWFEDFRQALNARYFKSLIGRLLGILALSLLGYAALIGATYLLMAFSVRPLYVFTEWVPENIVEWSSIAKVFWNLTTEAARLVRIGTRELREVEFWGGVLRWGMILLLLGAALLPKAKRAGKKR
ncbi:MAG: ABC transporter permease [Clostridia bacterium]|nr:ABC transporter permease [Clostridia bacterium]